MTLCAVPARRTVVVEGLITHPGITSVVYPADYVVLAIVLCRRLWHVWCGACGSTHQDRPKVSSWLECVQWGAVGHSSLQGVLPFIIQVDV